MLMFPLVNKPKSLLNKEVEVEVLHILSLHDEVFRKIYHTTYRPEVDCTTYCRELYSATSSQTPKDF